MRVFFRNLFQQPAHRELAIVIIPYNVIVDFFHCFQIPAFLFEGAENKNIF